MSTNVISPLLTDAGLDALIALRADGLQGQIVEVRLGDANGQGYDPRPDQTGLVNPRVKLPITGGRRIAPKQLQVTSSSVRESDFIQPGKFPVREVGFFLQNGTMLAVWSHKILEVTDVSPGEDIAFSFNLSLERLPADAVTVKLEAPSVPDYSVDFSILTTALVNSVVRHVKTSDRLANLEAELDRRFLQFAFLCANQIGATVQRLSAANFLKSGA